MPHYDYTPVATQHHRAEAPSIAELVRGRPYDPQSCTGNLNSPYVGSPPTVMPFKRSMEFQAELVDRSGRHNGQHDPQLTVAGPQTFLSYLCTLLARLVLPPPIVVEPGAALQEWACRATSLLNAVLSNDRPFISSLAGRMCLDGDRSWETHVATSDPYQCKARSTCDSMV